MKKLLSAIIILLVFTSVHAQEWKWAREGLGGAQNNEILGTSINNNGEVFICGYYTTSLYIVGPQLTSSFQGDYNSFMAKYDAAGNPIWCRNIAGVQPDANSGMAISSDTLGNCYVVEGNGYISSTPGSLFNYASSYGGFHGFKKVNSTGGDVWSRTPSFAPSSACTYEAIKTDGAGNTYLTGTFSGSVTFGSVTLNSPGVQDAMVVKYDANGNVVYAIQGTSNGASIAHGIDIDSTGAAVIVGEFQSGITFGTTVLTNNGQRDYFMARISPAGAFVWAKADGSTANDALYGVAIDYPRIYVTGIFNADHTFGSIAVTTHGGQDILVACTDISGNELFAKSNGGGSSDDIGYGAAVDHSGGVYFSGNYLGPATFGSSNIVGSNSAYLVKYDIIGNQQWVKTVNGGGIVVVSGKCLVSNNRNELALGSVFTMYGGNITFSGSTIALSCNGGPGNYGSGYYVAKLGNCTMSANAGTDVSLNCSDTVSLVASGGSSYAWSPSTGLLSTNNDTVLAHPVVTTDYIVTVGDSTGCYDSDTVRVTVTGGPVIAVAGDTVICAGESTQLTASGASTYSWSPTSTLDNAAIYNPTATPPVGNTLYTVVGTDTHGCSNSEQVTVIVNPLPAIPTITVNVNVLTSSTAAGYQWYLNGGPISGANDSSYTVLVNGIYTVTITDSNGCTRSSAPLLFNSVGIGSVKNAGFLSSIPNPLTHDVEVFLTAGNISKPRFRVIDAFGRTVIDESFASNHFLLKKDLLATGVYYYSLMDKDAILFTRKLLVE
jgi:hypothetical protein